ncbi:MULTISPECIES: EAL domain-containing protein [unclassified Duganella]|uniref:bifunctional diguanylate cyclase/phosphodiesterase n=1 Tax=unclassified Duganella TaxID=2636909 RepID=UPI00087F7823|nr:MULTISPECIES: EAL domain-containing protein [unclassified Duganella]SDG35936.1 PAS domain S-box-containing protein/diguanylate cyclase (GGDEF) domain-containing protein [Duganella sp. OV458]SDJ67491.1 PAS domain S-box-containing protein/diguanylate cyclase (GGDEF) domain-containing protein [Duganella sp. OV510]
MSSSRKSSRISLAAILTLLTGCAVTSLLFVAVSALEYSKMELSYQQRGHMRAAAIRRGMDDTLELVTIINSLFKSVGPVSREQFASFSRPLLERYPFVQAFNFQRVMNGEQARQHQDAMQRLYAGYRLHDGGGQPLAVRPQHIIVDYLEPLEGNEAAFGLDVASLPVMARAIADAVDHAQPRTTPLLRLEQERDGQQGFVMMMPVYRDGAEPGTLEQRRAAWLGNTGAVIRSTDLIQKILLAADLLDDPELMLQVYIGDDMRATNLVYSRGEPAAEAPAPHALQRWLAFDYREPYVRTFSAAGKSWHVQVTPLPRPFLPHHLGSLSTLLGGLLFSLLTAAFVNSLARRSVRVQRLVDERTAALKLSNEQLAEDVAARKRTEEALQESEHRFRRLLALSSDWYWEQDEQFRFTNITGGFFDKGKQDPQLFLGKTRWESHPERWDNRWGREHQAALEAHMPFTNLEYSLTGLDGQTHWFTSSGEPVFDRSGKFRGYRGTGTEITERKEAEQRIQHIAHHDVLTGLPNRVLLQDRLAQAVAFANRSGRPLWVMLIDLDRFKFVNDSMGHKAGDLLLKTVAQRLQDSVRDSDTVARLSGDEFVAILTESPQQALSAEVAQRIMRAVTQPVMLEGKEFFVTCSIGVAVYGADGTSAQRLIEHADIAMYRAKKLGRNNTQFYEPAMNEEARERLRIESALRNAVERQEFVLHYQPQVDLQSGRVVGVEALLRWQHPELGMVAPARFIALAEETGLIVEIGAWVLRTACAQARAWQDAGMGALRVAVNLSPRQFSEPQLLASIDEVLRQTGLPPSCLDIEVTEGLFMHDVTQAVELLHKLKALGLALSIDDFGTGYSSFSYLRHFPIDVLKIDRSFISDISDGDEAAIVVSIIALAHNLKLRVIAEGVETETQLDYLRRHGCDEIQGYYFSPPLPAAAFEQLLQQGQTLPSVPALA